MIALLGRKKGMASFFDDRGRNTAVTILEAGPCPILQRKTSESDGYNAVQIGFEKIRPKLATKPLLGHFKRAGQAPHRLVRELRDFSGAGKVGDVLTVQLFQPGDKVAVTGVSKGRGFMGVVKRHNFKCPNQTHGTHESFRGSGSVGQSSDPSRIWAGMRMPGHMGAEKVTVKNLKVLKIDAEKGLLMVKGAVPGAPNGIVIIRKQG